MSGTLGQRLQARLRGVDERAPAAATNTQFLIQVSGYEWVAGTCGPLAGRLVLDAATGEGYGAGVLRQAGARVVGIDLDRAAVGRASRAHPGVRFVAMDAAILAFGADTFDLVVSQDTLEHVADDTGLVGETHRVLKPGGVFALFTPHAPQHTQTPANPFHLREYSPQSLLALLGRHFDEVRLFGRRPGPGMRAAEQGMDSVRRYDPFGLRRLLVPRFVRHRLGSFLLHRRGGAGLERLSATDVEYFEGVKGSGTLIAVCVKRGATAAG